MPMATLSIAISTKIFRSMLFKTSNGRKQACNHTEDQSMGIAQSGLTKEGSQETTSDEEHDGYCGRQGGMEITLSTLQAGCSRVSAHERDIGSQEKKSVSIHIAGDQGKEDGRNAHCTRVSYKVASLPAPNHRQR
jgi:hypothetical protein